MFKVIKKGIDSINSSTYFAGLMMLVLNLGSKYITIELSKTQQEYLRNSIGRQFMIFTIIWLGIRDILKSLVLTAVFTILADYLFNEDSKMCIVSQQMQNIKAAIDTNNDDNVSDIEISNALKVLEKSKEKLKRKEREEQLNYFSQVI